MSEKSKVRNLDVFKKMNFLIQASHLYKPTTNTSINRNEDNNTTATNNKDIQSTSGNEDLSNFYYDIVKQTSRRGVIRMNPRLKKSICKNCSSLLISGVSATVRLKGNRESHISLKCNKCGTVKRFNTNKKREKNKLKKLKLQENKQINNKENSKDTTTTTKQE